MGKNKKSLLLLFLIFIVDRLIKNFFWRQAPLYQEGNFFTVVGNKQVAFSLPIDGYLLYLLLAVLIFFVGWNLGMTYKKRSPLFFFWGLIFIGAISNIIDRLRWGVVVDYVNLGWWPIFNLSDSLIVVGIASLIFMEFKKKRTYN